MNYDELMKQIRSLENDLSELNGSSEFATCREIIAGATHAEEELYEQFQKAIEKVRKNKSNAENQLNKLNTKTHWLQLEIDKLKQEQANMLKALAAQEKLDEIKGQVREIAAEFQWSNALRDYQWDDIFHQCAAYQVGKEGVVNANDRGLGKTLESIAMLDIMDHLFYAKHGRKPLTLWLTKKSLVGTTFAEFRKWSPDRKLVKITKIPDKQQREMMATIAIQTNSTIIVNYEALNTTPLLAKTDFDIIVMDEVHRLKGGANPKPTQIFLNTRDACHKASWVMPLTGTPIVNHPKDIWCYLNIFDPVAFPTVKDFEARYLMGYGMLDEDGKPIFEIDWSKLIMGALKDRVIRKSKQEVLTELPDKIREFRLIELEGEQLMHYQMLRKHFFTWLDESAGKALSATSILAQLTRLRQCAIYPGGITVKEKDIHGTVISSTTLDCQESAKLDEAMEIVEELLNEGEQVAIFSSQFNEPLFELSRRIEEKFDVKTEVLTGANSADLEQYQDRFQQGITKVLLANMKTGGEGLNLQKSDTWPGGASNAIFLDLWYTPAMNEQAEDRLHRMGQKDTVNIYILQAEDSVDQFIQEILDRKEMMISGIMERDELRTGSDWKSLLEGLL